MNEVTIYPYLKFESEREESLFHKIIFDADGGFLSFLPRRPSPLREAKVGDESAPDKVGR